jgi:hypothetical protein
MDGCIRSTELGQVLQDTEMIHGLSGSHMLIILNTNHGESNFIYTGVLYRAHSICSGTLTLLLQLDLAGLKPP